jgi:hypothetical protein
MAAGLDGQEPGLDVRGDTEAGLRCIQHPAPAGDMHGNAKVNARAPGALRHLRENNHGAGRSRIALDSGQTPELS